MELFGRDFEHYAPIGDGGHDDLCGVEGGARVRRMARMMPDFAKRGRKRVEMVRSDAFKNV